MAKKFTTPWRDVSLEELIEKHEAELDSHLRMEREAVNRAAYPSAERFLALAAHHASIVVALKSRREPHHADH